MRRPNVLLVAAVVLSLCEGVVGLVVISAQQQSIATQQHALAGLVRQFEANVQAQVTNRVRNVAAWCGGINAGRDYNRKLVARFHLTYTLADLDCASLERKTAASAHAHLPKR